MKENDDENSTLSDRRHPLSERELAAIKDQLLLSIYADIGQSVVKKILWVAGACAIALFAWLSSLGHIKIG